MDAKTQRVDHNNAKNLDLLRIIWKYFVHFFCLVLPIKSDFFIRICGRLLHAVFADFAVLIELVPKVSSLQSLSHFYRPFSNKRIWLKFLKFKVLLYKTFHSGQKTIWTKMNLKSVFQFGMSQKTKSQT